MVEQGTVGGTCVNTGCVPSKALRAAAQARQVALDHHFPSVTTLAGPVDLGTLTGATHALMAAMRTEKYLDLAADHGWEIVRGTARFVGDLDEPALEVTPPDGDTVSIRAAHYVVATGSVPWVPPIEGLAAAGYLTSTTAMALEELPTSMLVIGGNAVGLEQAQLFARLGVAVTILEVQHRVAPFEEPEVSQAVEDALAEEGVSVLTGVEVTAVARDGHGHRDTRGLVKLVAERGTGRVRGVHVVADGAGEVILAGGYAIRSGMTVAELATADLVHAVVEAGRRNFGPLLGLEVG